MSNGRPFRRSIAIGTGRIPKGYRSGRSGVATVFQRRSVGIAAGFRSPLDDRLTPSADRYDASETKPRPWETRERNRRRNTVARRSRRG